MTPVESGGSTRQPERLPVGGGTREELRNLLDVVRSATGVPFRAVLSGGDGEGVELHDSLGRSGVRRRSILAGDLELRLEFADEVVASGPVSALLERSLDALVRREREVRLFSREMAERYEEITLLTSISETLGAHLHIRTAAKAVLDEVAAALDVRRVALWLTEEGEEELVLYAAHGAAEAAEVPAGGVERARAEEAFRRQETLFDDGGSTARAGGSAEASRARMLTVPVSHAPAEGPSRTLGVLHLSDDGETPFTAGDLQLVGAVASQIAAAIQNGRLVQESLQRERMLAELDIAHDLQLKLLPNLEGFSDLAEVAARCEPAHSVGGDFYLLIRLSGGRLGVMLGDVSSHGMSAALIMALTMSAAAIYARESERPGEVLLDIHRQLLRELESTEMYMTLFYGVLDASRGTLCYANAGHGYAFRLSPEGTARLEAMDPPVGMTAPDGYREREDTWSVGEDVLLLCTDGLVEGWGGSESERVLEAATEARAHGVQAIVRRLFERWEAAEKDDRRDDRTALALRA